MRTEFIIIGISDAAEPHFPPEVLERIGKGKVFSGGRRHHEIVARWLPEHALWIDITVPLDSVFDQYRRYFAAAENNVAVGEEPCIVVFASGDPLFFGFANTVQRKMPDALITVFPYFNSLQMLAHRLVMPYHDMHIVSLTGRPWHEFDAALIRRMPKIGILTDGTHTPAAIAQRMLCYGYTYYNMSIGERLGHPEQERITTLTLEEAAEQQFDKPNCVILQEEKADDYGERSTLPPHPIPDHLFELLDGREKMITKAPIRWLTLAALELQNRQSMWDIGFCTGSVSIEAKLLFPHLHITAFEIREEGRRLMEVNSRRFHAPGIDAVIGDFLQTDVSQYAQPDAVFIGGHGGQLKSIMAKALQHLAPDGLIVMNSVTSPKVSTDSHALWDEACRELGLQQEPPLRIKLNDYNPIEILKCKRQPSSK